MGLEESNQWLDSEDEILTKMPLLERDKIQGWKAIWNSDGGWLAAAKAINAIGQFLKDSGVRFGFGGQVTTHHDTRQAWSADYPTVPECSNDPFFRPMKEPALVSRRRMGPSIMPIRWSWPLAHGARLLWIWKTSVAQRYVQTRSPMDIVGYMLTAGQGLGICAYPIDP